MTRAAKACMIVTAVLPWYGMLSGSFLLYVFVLMAVSRLGYATFVAFWIGVIPLALLLLFVNPALLVAALAGNCSLPKPALGAALLGTAITLTFSATYASLSALVAIKDAGMLSQTEPNLIFAALAGLNATVLAGGTWCAWVSTKTLSHRLAQPARDQRPS